MTDPTLDLEDDAEETLETPSISLPFHPVTFLLGIWKRRNMLILFLIPLFVFAVIVAKLTRTREYESTALLLYEPPAESETEENSSQLSLYTMLDIVKTPETLNAIRDKTQTPARIKTIGAAIHIGIRKKTTLLEIKTTWDNPQVAADIANATYDVFFENLVNLQNSKRQKALKELTTRLQEVKAELVDQDQELRQFTLDNQIVDLDKEALAYLQQLVTLNTDYNREISHLDSVRKQKETLDDIIRDLKEKASEEAEELAAQSSSVTEANVKVQRLRERISEAQTSRAREADLAVKNEDLKRATKLRELDAISQSEYEKILAEYKRVEALSTDTDEIVSWKNEIKKLDESIVPKTGSMSTASAAIMNSMILRSIDLQLEATASAERSNALERASQRAQKRLDIIPQVKQAYTERLRRVEALANDRKNLQEMTAKITRQLGSSQIPFRVISRATPSLFHKRSDTKLIFIIIFMMGAMIIGSIVILLELLDFTIKSRGSLAAALPAPPLAVFPHRNNPTALLPGHLQPENHIQTYRRFILELKRLLPRQPGCIILLTGTAPEAGTTTIALNLAARLQDPTHNVLILDGHTAAQTNRPRHVALSDLIDPDPDQTPGLGDYLCGGDLDSEALLQPLPSLRTKAVICSKRTAIPELLNATRFPALIDDLKTRFDYILIDAPALEEGIDTEYLAQFADVAIYVVQSGKINIFREKKAYRRLESSGVDIVGTVLTNVSKLYEKV